MNEQTNCRVQGDTTQGMYIAGADGTAYCWKNTPGISDTLRFLDKGLAAFKEKPPKKVEITQEAIDKPFTRVPKPTTSVIAIYSRMRPIPEGSDTRNRNLGLDYFWISKDEVHEILEGAVGEKKLELPQTIIARLVRFGLVDVIRGEPDYWTPTEVSRADFKLKRVEGDDLRHHFVFKGDFSSRTFWFTRGIEGHIDGEFIIDPETQLVDKFRAYAQCKAWGSSEWGGRGAPVKTFQLVFGLTETHDKMAREVPPSALSRHKDYAAPAFPTFK